MERQTLAVSETHTGSATININVTFHQKARNSSITPGHIPKGLYILYRDFCLSILDSALFTIARKQKQPICSSTDEWIINM